MAKLSEKYEAVVVFSLKNGEDAVKALVAKFSDLIKEHAVYAIPKDMLTMSRNNGQPSSFMGYYQDYS